MGKREGAEALHRLHRRRVPIHPESVTHRRRRRQGGKKLGRETSVKELLKFMSAAKWSAELGFPGIFYASLLLLFPTFNILNILFSVWGREGNRGRQSGSRGKHT